MANMTVSSVSGKPGSHLKRVTFTHTSAGTAAGSTTTTEDINGMLLRAVTTGGDASWTFVLNDGTADIYTSPALSATATSVPLYQVAAGSLTQVTDDESDFAYGIPLSGQALTCTTAGVTTTAPTITVIFREY